jgi:hypothetical protein
MSMKRPPFPITEKRTTSKTHNVKSSGARQAWKLDIDSVGEAVSFIAAAFSSKARELGTKTATGFLSGGAFHWDDGARRTCRSSFDERKHLHR